MKDPVVSKTYFDVPDNLPDRRNSKQRKENQNFSQYQQIPNFLDKKVSIAINILQFQLSIINWASKLQNQSKLIFHN